MTIQKFIETAIEGGWKPYFLEGQAVMKVGDRYAPALFSAIALDPKVWEAVGKVKGWGELRTIVDGEETFMILVWKKNMCMMVNSLCEGKTLESYIETL